jgi:monomeric sarcosine oxidase
MVNYDVIVVGLGGLGSVVAHDLAASGASVLGLDRHGPGHALGSSHGQTRAIRKAYFEHPDYVPLLQRSYQRWRELEQVSAEDLLDVCGVLQVGSESGVVIPGVARAAAQHQLSIEKLSNDDLRKRYPQLHFNDEQVGLLEADGGMLRVELAVRTWAKQAQLQGATLRFDSSVLGYSHEGTHWRVITDQGDFFSERLVLCPGAWAVGLLPGSLTRHFQLRRKSLFWFDAPASFSRKTGFPVWLFERDDGIFYGFPKIAGSGLKAAEHSGGQSLHRASQLDRTLQAPDEARLRHFFADQIPLLKGASRLQHAVCMYTLSPDEHFLVGSLTGHQHLSVGAGLSGHGFKMVPALGEALAQSVLGERPSLNIDLFDPQRFEPGHL